MRHAELSRFRCVRTEATLSISSGPYIHQAEIRLEGSRSFYLLSYIPNWGYWVSRKWRNGEPCDDTLPRKVTAMLIAVAIRDCKISCAVLQ